MSWGQPIEVDGPTVLELQRALDHVVQLGAEVAVVRLDHGEVLAAAERRGWRPRRDRNDGVIHARRLWRSAAMGVFARTDLGEVELERVTERLRHVLRWGVTVNGNGVAP